MIYIYPILILFTLAFGCKSDKVDCYNSKLSIIAKSNQFIELMQAAKRDLPSLKDKSGKRLFIDKSYIDSVTIDEAVFFNFDRNKCLLLILQQTSKDLYLDQVMVVQGTFTDGRWIFKPDRLPDVPMVIYTVRKSGERQAPINNSFENLSKRARIFVLTAGTPDSYRCDIDNEYWFGSPK